MPQYLYSRNSKGKLKVLELSIFKMPTHYEIRRRTGLLNGKLTDQPVISIHKGKVNRTLMEQVELEARSIVNKKRDEGYKLLQELEGGDATDPFDYNTIDAKLSQENTYVDGNKKVMLALDPKTRKNFNWNIDWWVSRKLDGVRAMVTFKDKQWSAFSRKGKDMNAPFTNIFKSKKFLALLKKLPEGCSIDGELYIHGRPLDYISGLSRKKDYDPEIHDELEFWIFDYTSETDDAETRATLLNSLQEHFGPDDKIKINAQVKLSSYISIKKIHDLWVQAGFEGAICRDASRLYGHGVRDERMVKVKEFDDAEFEIIGMVEGLRPEDMVFICIMEDGKTFEVKPNGTRELRYQYIRDIDSIVGKKLTVSYFGFTENGIPKLAKGKVIRDYE